MKTLPCLLSTSSDKWAKDDYSKNLHTIKHTSIDKLNPPLPPLQNCCRSKFIHHWGLHSTTSKNHTLTHECTSNFCNSYCKEDSAIIANTTVKISHLITAPWFFLPITWRGIKKSLLLFNNSRQNNLRTSNCICNARFCILINLCNYYVQFTLKLKWQMQARCRLLCVLTFTSATAPPVHRPPALRLEDPALKDVLPPTPAEGEPVLRLILPPSATDDEAPTNWSCLQWYHQNQLWVKHRCRCQSQTSHLIVAAPVLNVKLTLAPATHALLL